MKRPSKTLRLLLGYIENEIEKGKEIMAKGIYKRGMFTGYGMQTLTVG